MAFNAAELTKNGELKIAGNLNTRLPAITNGLIAHFPFDGRGGSFDGIGGIQTIQNVETGINLIEAMQKDWRDPSSWSSNAGMSWDESKQALRIEGYHNTWLNTPIVVDTSKQYQISIEVMEEVQSSTGLYLGGLSNNAAGQRVTTNYDYSYGSNAQPATGVWTKYCTTRTGTGGIVSRTSQTFDNINGWTGDNAGVTDKLTKYYYYGGLFNYSSGGVMYIRNLNVTIISSDTSNTTITNDGIAIEETTTNLFPISDTKWIINKSNYQGTVNIISNTEKWIKTGAHFKFRPRLDTATGGWQVAEYRHYYLTYNTSSQYTLSFDLKILKPYNLNVSMRSPGGIDTVLDYFVVNYVDYYNEWKRFTITFTPLIATGVSTCIYITGNENAEFMIANPQLEVKPFATSFVIGSQGLGKLEIPFPLYGLNAGTINMEVYFPDTSKLINNQIWLWDYNGTQGGPWYGINNYSSEYTMASFGNESATLYHKAWHTYTIVKSNDNTVKTYIDGVLKQTSNDSATAAFFKSSPKLYLGQRENSYISNIRIKNLSFYNRALSETEIQQLTKPTFELKPNGDLVSSKIISKPIIPDDVYYFPLGLDGKDQYKTIVPVTESNTVYKDGTVWVGTATTNILGIASAGFGPWGTMTGSSVNFTAPDGTQGAYLNISSFTDGGAEWYNTGGQKTATASTVYTVSAKVKFKGSGYPSPNLLYLRQYRTDGTQITEGGLFSSSRLINLGDGWYQTYTTFTTTAETTKFLIQGYEYKTYETWIYDVQCEQKPFYSPFTIGVRDKTLLYYNLYRDIGLQWNGNWTIAYWKKPVGTNTGNSLDGYNISQIGWDNNSPKIIWYGKNSGSNNLTLSTQGSINSIPIPDINKYFNNWQLAVLTKNGNTITHKLYGLQETPLSLSIDGSGITAGDILVSPAYGYDLFLEGFTSNPSNSYVKDLIVAKRVLTDDEINTIYYYKNPMQYLNDGTLQIKDSIKTKQVIT